MATILKRWREAAALMLVTAKSRGVSFSPVASTGKNEFELLLLKRSSKSKFMPNVYVFPGGVASDADFSQEWLDIFNLAGKETASELFKFVQRGGPGAPMFSRTRDPQFGSIPSEIAFRICAIRETFEESGVLLARCADSLKHVDPTFVAKGPVPGSVCADVNVIEDWRDRVDKYAYEFITMCKELELIPDVWSLYEWANWLTPASAKRRYDTAFFICCIDEKPDVTEDKRETVHSQWISSADISRGSQGGNANVALPQAYEMSRFLNFTSLEELHRFSFERSAHRVTRWMSSRSACQDGFFYALPGDDLYAKNPDFEGIQDELTYSESLDELAIKYPNHHRYVLRLSESGTGKRKMDLLYNIDMECGHVPPLMLNTTRSRL